jgi:hypothetical protein
VIEFKIFILYIYIWLEYWRSVWLLWLYLRCPMWASSVSTVLPMPPSFVLFSETMWWHISRKYEHQCTCVCDAVLISLHRKCCCCGFSKTQYTANRLIWLWVRMCFWNHVPVFCNTILRHRYGISSYDSLWSGKFTAPKYTFFIESHKSLMIKACSTHWLYRN